MGRKRRHARRSAGKGGALTKLRGGFRSTVHTVAGAGKPRPVSRARQIVTNIITVALLAVAAAILLRRFGVWR
jgi:hypothetical protein